MNIYLPFSKLLITQKFGDNANPLYAQEGLKGHPAYDWGAPWDSPVRNCAASAYCYSVMHKDDPTLMDYRAVFTIVEDGNDIYELSYGHLHTIVAEVGKTYQVGDILGTVGNTGPVYAGSHEVTEAEKDAGSHAGAHLHGPQVRPVMRVKTIDYSSGNGYLMDATGFYKDSDGWYYKIINYTNGYNGCINFAPFSTETLAIDYKPVQASTQAEVAAVLPTIQNDIQQLPGLPMEQRKASIGLIAQFLTYLSNLLK